MQVAKFIYGLEQACRSWNLRFNKTIKSYGFEQSLDEACMYKLIKDQAMVFLILYVDDTLFIVNNVEFLSKVKKWLTEQFQMKGSGEASFVLGIKIYRYRKSKLLALS